MATPQTSPPPAAEATPAAPSAAPSAAEAAAKPVEASTPAEAPQPAAAEPPKKLSLAARLVRVALVLAALAGAAWIAWRFFGVSGDEYTNAAQVEAFIAPINTRVGGYVKEVKFIAHQKIKKGDTLVIIDDRELRTQLAQAEANYLDARASKDVATASVNTVSNSTTVADANLAELGPNLLVARKDYQRYANLLRDDAVTQQQFDQKKAAYDALLAKRQALLGQRQSTELSTAEARSKLRVNDANIARMKAALDFARLNLSYTAIRAPYDGTLGRRNLQVGQLVQAGQSLGMLVRGGVQWVTANFRETQIAKLRIGQPARITVDALGGQSLQGRIGAISEATGSQYSAVPVDNSTGNFVKVQQRIPVRIEFTEANAKADLDRLRSGMSVEVYVQP
ncbi:MAG: HlyD family secretion protein [Janthinobacterium lividum]